MPPDMLFVNRLQFGFYSVLARLDVEVDYAKVERDFFAASLNADGTLASDGPTGPKPATQAGTRTPRTRSA